MARRSKGFSLLSVAVAAVGTVACAPEDGAPTVQRSQGALAAGDRGDLDILFMVDNSSSMTPLQMKMLTQDPSFMTVLANFPNGLPNIHVAVVSSDMGAPGDSAASIGCSHSDNGVFQSTARGTCTNTTLASGANFISNIGGQANYTGSLPNVFSCIAQLGSSGCGFEHQLAAVARALGADGAPPPAENAGFLRPNAELAIVLLTNEDDCSAPANTTLFSLNGGTQGLTNPLGPIANYRCNQFGHLCKNPLSSTPNALTSPPLNAPSSSTTTPPSLNLTDCESNDTGMLTAVSGLIAGIKGLKARPDDQIVVGAIFPPKVPYTVEWVPPSSPPPGTSGEIWPQVQHSCGAAGGDDVNPAATQHTTDGSFGDPGVRIAQWVQGFGANGVVASICDADYGIAFQAIADKIQAHLQPSTSTGAGGAGGTSASGTAGTNGGGAGASGSAGHAGAAGGSGSGGTFGTTGVAGNGGTGTAGSNGSTGTAGSNGSTGTAGSSGAAGQGAGAGSSGTGVGGASAGTGIGGNTAGANGNAGGASGGGSGHPGGAGGNTTASGAGGAAAGTSGTGTAGQAGSAGATGTGGHGTGGHAGAMGGNGGASNASADGCSCETAGSPASGWNLTLLVGALGLVVSRRSKRRSTGRP